MRPDGRAVKRPACQTKRYTDCCVRRKPESDPDLARIRPPDLARTWPGYGPRTWPGYGRGLIRAGVDHQATFRCLDVAGLSGGPDGDYRQGVPALGWVEAVTDRQGIDRRIRSHCLLRNVAQDRVAQGRVRTGRVSGVGAREVSSCGLETEPSFERGCTSVTLLSDSAPDIPRGGAAGRPGTRPTLERGETACLPAFRLQS